MIDNRLKRPKGKLLQSLFVVHLYISLIMFNILLIPSLSSFLIRSLLSIKSKATLKSTKLIGDKHLTRSGRSGSEQQLQHAGEKSTWLTRWPVRYYGTETRGLWKSVEIERFQIASRWLNRITPEYISSIGATVTRLQSPDKKNCSVV